MSYRGNTIPDLRNDTDEITLDHCYTLVTYFGKVMDIIDGVENVNEQMLGDYHVEDIQKELQKYFNCLEFSRLFRTNEGKCVLVGVYIASILREFVKQKNK